MKDWVLVGAGGSIGAILRFGAGKWLGTFSGNDFPWATFAVNLLGCFMIGIAWTLLKGQSMESQRLLLITGILGGFTTFSSFSIETFQLIQNGQTTTAILYAIGSLVLGLFLSFLGYFFTETLG